MALASSALDKVYWTYALYERMLDWAYHEVQVVEEQTELVLFTGKKRVL